MTPYYTDDQVTLFHGDCLEVLPTLPDASVDAVVTDPPYGLEFMGKEWDTFPVRQRGQGGTGSNSEWAGGVEFSTAPAAMAQFQAWCAEWATEALRVLKPGGHLVAFGGTRTWHRLTCAIEDAGFEIRDNIMWQHMEHVFCQCQAVPYNYARVSRQDLPGVRQDVAADDALSGDTEQDVQPGVRGQADQQGAQRQAHGPQHEGDGCVCGLRQADTEAPVAPCAGNEADVLTAVQRETTRAGVGEARGQGCRCTQDDAGHVRGQEPGMEGRSDLPQGQGQLRRPAIRQVTEVGFADGAQGRLHHGAPPSDGGADRATAGDDGSGEPHQPRPEGQPTGELGTVPDQRGPQARRGWPLCDWCGKPLAPPVDHCGPLLWEYGSGFPKSLDVSKAIDKAAGAEREVVRVAPRPETSGTIAGSTDSRRPWIERSREVGYHEVAGPTPATDAARQWQGWGTALKPAYEPIVLARKPLSGTVAATVLEHGTGALNIDGCRVGTGGEPAYSYPKGAGGSRFKFDDAPNRPDAVEGSPLGRWPANVILDADAAAMLDRQSGVSVSVAAPRGVPGIRQNGIGETVYKGGPIGEQGEVRGHNDTGGASRFFYTAKADQNERPRVNGVAHPTVKPLDLMRWLVRLVTPPGGVVLEPFAGSGTTAEACVVEGFYCIAIEREADYLPLIVARLSKPIERTLL